MMSRLPSSFRSANLALVHDLSNGKGRPDDASTKFRVPHAPPFPSQTMIPLFGGP